MKKHIFLTMIDEIETCLDRELYISALMLALTIPDICGKAEYPEDGNTSRYIKWFNSYMKQYKRSTSVYGLDMPFLSGKVIYNLRNSMIHSGNPNIEVKKISEDLCKIDQFELRFEKDFSGDTSHISYGSGMRIVERGYVVNAYLLCYRLCQTAKDYFHNNTEKFDFFNYTIIENDKDD